MKYLLILILLLLFSIGCNNQEIADKNQAMGEKTVKVVDLNSELPGLSIYHLPSSWTTQDNEQIELKDLRGNILIVVMIYTSCKAACPRLVADMRNIEKQIPKKDLYKTKFVLVSIDPETDTPENLKRFSKDNLLEDEHWLFLRGTPGDTREFAAVLAVNYKRISPIDFTHSNIISVFDEKGVLVHQQEGLGLDNSETIEAIKAEILD